MRFQSTFTPTIRIILSIMAALSIAGIIVAIVVLAGVVMEITPAQAWLLLSVCTFSLIVSTLLVTIHYKVDATHVRLNMLFVDMLGGRIRIDNILNIVIDKGKLYISFLWKGPDPVIALISIKPKRYQEFKDILMMRNPNIVFYENKENETTDSKQQ